MEETITLSGTGTRLRTELDVPLFGDYKIALQDLSMHYSWPNITDDNNELKYTMGGILYTLGGVQKTITLPRGAYSIKDIALFVRAELKRKGDENVFKLGGSSNTMKTYIDVLSDDCVVNIGDSSIKNVLGWTGTRSLPKGTHSSEKTVNITNVNKVLIHCSIVRGAYTALSDSGGLSSKQTVLANFYPDVPPGYKVVVEPQRLYYKRANTTMIKYVYVWLTDQDGNPIDNGDEQLFVSLHVKPLIKGKDETRT